MDTRIYGTIGPSCCEKEMLIRLFEKGMTGVRINLSHANLSDVEDWIFDSKAAYEAVKTEREMLPLEILIDLIGPELRLGALAEEIELKTGDMLTIVPEGGRESSALSVPALPKVVFENLEAGMVLLIDDGKLLLEVKKRKSDTAECMIQRGGILRGGKSVAIPGMSFETPTLTERDIFNIRRAKEYGITGVMLPFVREKEDLCNLRQALEEAGAKELRVFAKIENRTGVEKLPELLPFCDEIVIARGDLGNAVALWELPAVQAEIARLCREKKKPFMVVTQMLASMETCAVPTRAEVSDIFRAVNEGAASVMLTGETAAGSYPAEAMEYLANTVRAAEKYCAVQTMEA